MKNLKIFGIIIAIAMMSIASATDVSGPQSGTWPRANSPYYVVGDVSVLDGEILTIEPGVEVWFNEAHAIIVEGTLIAPGGVRDSIYFRTNFVGNWDNIKFNYADPNCYLDYCVIENGGAAGDGNIAICNSIGNVQILNSTIIYSASNGIYIEASVPSISKCTIQYNNANGILVNNPTVSSAPLVRYTNIWSNTDNGVLISSGAIDLGTEKDPGYNEIMGNGIFAVNNQTANGISAVWNYWGETDSTIIDGMIYDDEESGISTAIVDFCPYLPFLWSDTYYASADNGGRHLDNYHLTFQRLGTIHYNKWGWGRLEQIPDLDYAENPCLASYSYGNRCCVAYQVWVAPVYQGLRFANLIEPGAWDIYDMITPHSEIFPWGMSPPSMVLESSVDGDTCHLVVESYHGGLYEMSWDLTYYKFLVTNPTALIDTVVLDSMRIPIGADPSSTSPSIILDPLGRCHVAYSRLDNPIDPTSIEIYYIEETATGWSTPVSISRPSFIAIEPSISCWGDSVFIAWREEQPDKADIWRTARNINISPPLWTTPLNVCEAAGLPLEQESEYPVIAGSFTIWAENYSGANWETVCYNPIPGFGFGNISNTIDTSSVFPHADVTVYDGQTYLDAIWTEVLKETGQHGYLEVSEIRSSELTFAKRLPWYAVGVGQEQPSPYTIYRDGYITYPSGVSIDYAYDKLIYHLPYLDPNYDYSVMVIGYHESCGKWNEQVKIDGKMARVLQVEAGIPDTVEMTIPLNYYQDDREVELTIRRLTGDYAGIKEIIVYRYEHVSHGGGGPQSTGTNIHTGVTDFSLRQNYPNPFKSSTAIRYQLPQESKVTLKIYNIQGQMLKTLINESEKPGNYTVLWNGTDEIGRKVPNGVYFYELDVAGFTSTKKLVKIK